MTSENIFYNLLSNSDCFVYENEKNEIIGFAFLVSSGNPNEIYNEFQCYIRFLTVSRKYSGQNIGHKITEKCIEKAKQNGEISIALHTSEFMNAAKYIYEKIGFKITKELEPRLGKKYWLYELILLNKNMIDYQIENNLSSEEFIQVLINSTLGERRPVGELDRIEKMLEHGNLIVTARHNGKLVGVSRSLTDFVYCTYLSDLAIDEKYQKQGIGKELIRLTKQETPKAKLILLAAPKAVDYYPKIGLTKWEQCYFIDTIDDLK
ncbi:GNAT family N-acetyltransferase [Bernardetia sp. OM2101]|uniref:GNAT family N-acetyltransferase n=1 Tax=Bernardetia sp. OM2101 TaxID=3344876 RepID=UPI0035CEE1E1